LGGRGLKLEEGRRERVNTWKRRVTDEDRMESKG
jgi:hypothetical protein